MREEKQPFPLCHLRGTWHEMGVQYGQDCKAEIEHMANWWKEVLVAHHPNLVPEKALYGSFAMYEDEMRAYAPRWIEFMEGTAQGAGLDYRHILWINVASIILDGPEWAMKAKGGCTTIGVQPDKTKIGKTIIGQNLDWHDELKVVALHMEPNDAPRVLAFTFAGALPQIGISEVGFGSFVNALTTPEKKSGVSMNIICAEALFASTFAEACERITMSNRSMSFNHMLGHKDGSLLDMETTPSNVGFLLPRNGSIVHANHFQTEWMQKDDLFKLAADTWVRQEWAEKYVEEAEGVSIDTFKEIFRDHHGDPTHAICCHPDPKLNYTETWSTVLSVISIPEDGVAYACPNPCQNEYVEYRL